MSAIDIETPDISVPPNAIPEIRTLGGVPTNPERLAEDPRFAKGGTKVRQALYVILLDHLGKVDADRLWFSALIALGEAHPSAVKS